MDTRNAGQRCRAKKVIRTVAGVIPARRRGTIRYEIDTMGKRLILVQWDDGPSTYAFTEEIEIVDSDLFFCRSPSDFCF